MGTGVSPGFFLWLDEEGVVVRAEGTGASSVEGVGRAFGKTIHPDDQERILEALDGPRPTSDLDGGPIALDFRRRTEEGWQKVRGLALPVEDGWILGCRASREESSSDDELRDKLQRYRLLFRQSPVGVLHYDTDLRVSDVNESLCRILRSSREKLVGLDMKELRDTRVLPALEAALRGEHGRYEGQYRATYSSAEVWVSLRTVPFHDARGRVRGGIGIAEDITERKEGERIQRALYRLSEAVHEAEDLAALFETIHRTLGRLMPAENIYLALYDEETRSLRFPYFVDERDEPPEGSLPLGRGVTEYVLRTEEALLAGPDDLTSLERAGEIELRGALPASWLGVPLKVGQEATGVLALQSYDPEVRFGEKERSVLAFVAEQVAMTVERKRQEAQIARMAYYDLLTSLPNRRMLQEKVPHFLAMGRRKGWPVSLLYLDLDRFKMINDTLGHDAGDQLLVAIARELERCVRASDLLGRLGGDEFAFVMSEAGPEEATRLARRVVEVLDRPFVVRGERVHVGCSIGIAVFPEHGETLEELLKHADIAMYRAKDSGVEYSVFDSEWSPYSRERLALEAELREAVAEDRLILAYQPVFRVADGSRAGVEALVRWPREGEEVPAAELVSLAEESDLIRSLDRFVLRRALRDFPGIASRADGDLELSVNLSPASLHQRGLTAALQGLLEETGVDPSRVVLEVTESAALRNPGASQRTLRELHEIGIRIAMDDFGSGFASVTYLRNMPFRRLKIDRSLVREIGTSSRGEQLIQGTILLGQSLGMEIVAEGVETEEQLEWLRDRGCDLVQGFLLGRPERSS